MIEAMPGEIEPTLGQIEPNIGKLRIPVWLEGAFHQPLVIFDQLSYCQVSWMPAIAKNHKTIEQWLKFYCFLITCLS